MKEPKLPRHALPPTSDSLPIVLLRARESVMAPIRKMLSHSDVTEQQWRILRVLLEHGASDAKSVAERACLLFPSLTRMAIAMETRGLISRKPDETDGRRLVLTITAKGRQVIESNLCEAVQIADDFKAKLGPDEYRRLIGLLQKLSD